MLLFHFLTPSMMSRTANSASYYFHGFLPTAMISRHIPRKNEKRMRSPGGILNPSQDSRMIHKCIKHEQFDGNFCLSFFRLFLLFLYILYSNTYSSVDPRLLWFTQLTRSKQSILSTTSFEETSTQFHKNLLIFTQ